MSCLTAKEMARQIRREEKFIRKLPEQGRCTMSRRTYYLVQTSPTLFVHKSGALGFVEGFGAAEAAQLSISEARRLYREFRAAAPDGDGPRRFPQILKVTTEMRTITAPNRKGER